MARLEKLTKKQEAQIKAKRDEWINFALFDGDDIDQQAVYDGLDFIYELSGLKKPVKIVVDSPYGVQLALRYAKELLKKSGKETGAQVDDQVRTQVYAQVDSQVRDQVRAQVDSQVRDQVYAQVRDQVYDQVRAQVRAQVRDQVRDQVRAQVYDQVGAQVGAQVRTQVDTQVDAQVYAQVYDQVGAQVGAQVYAYEQFAYETLAWRAGWTAYLEYFKDLGIFNEEKWDKLVSYNKSGQFMGVYLDGLAVVCRRPQVVRRDDEMRLHHDEQPAIEWRDGYKLYFIHGQGFDEKMFKRISSKKMTLKEVMGMKNADERTMAFSMLRPDRLLKGVGAKLVHTGQRGTRLFQVNNFTNKIGVSSTKDGDTEYCMVMDDASTDRQFLEWVDPEVGKHHDADLAQASAWNVPLEDYLCLEAEA